MKQSTLYIRTSKKSGHFIDQILILLFLIGNSKHSRKQSIFTNKALEAVAGKLFYRLLQYQDAEPITVSIGPDVLDKESIHSDSKTHTSSFSLLFSVISMAQM